MRLTIVGTRDATASKKLKEKCQVFKTNYYQRASAYDVWLKVLVMGLWNLKARKVQTCQRSHGSESDLSTGEGWVGLGPPLCVSLSLERTCILTTFTLSLT